MIVFLEYTFAYADIQTNDGENKTHMENDIFIVDWNKFDEWTSLTRGSN